MTTTLHDVWDNAAPGDQLAMLTTLTQRRSIAGTMHQLAGPTLRPGDDCPYCRTPIHHLEEVQLTLTGVVRAVDGSHIQAAAPAPRAADTLAYVTVCCLRPIRLANSFTTQPKDTP